MKPSPRPAVQILPSIPLSVGVTVLGRDPGSGTTPLTHQLVGHRHAEVTIDEGRAELRDLFAGTFVNGQRFVGSRTVIHPGDLIDIGPYALEFTGDKLVSRGRVDRAELHIHKVRKEILGRKGRKVLLDDVSLSFRPGEFACLIGPSGCGKSTLMSILSGRSAPDDGVVQLNGRDLHANFEMLKQNLVFVPQRTILHSRLTVGQALKYTARLRLLFDTPETEIDKRIEQVLSQMNIEDTRTTLIRQLSGGQEKRACLANELLSNPGLVFLDEVTSGLDELTDRDMMRLFRQLANQGKTVVCVTHNLMHVAENCDLIVILTHGGHLAFVGPPSDALRYFEVPALGDIYEALEQKSPKAWCESFLESQAYNEYVANRIPKTPPVAQRQPAIRHNWTAESRTIGRQARILTERNLAVLRSDIWSVAGLFGQMGLVAAVLMLAFGTLGDFPTAENSDVARVPFPGFADGDPPGSDLWHERMDYIRATVNLSFLLVVTSFWFGCNNAAREIVRERTITTQERQFNLRAASYFVSKLFTLTAISWTQCICLLIVVWWSCDPHGSAVAHVIVMLALSFAGTATGLFLSAVAPSESVAVTLIPVAVIPQIILSGAIVPVTDWAKSIASCFVTTYWGKLAVDSLLTGDPGKFGRRDDVKYIEAATFVAPLLAVIAQAAVFIVLTILVLAPRSKHVGYLTWWQSVTTIGRRFRRR